MLAIVVLAVVAAVQVECAPNPFWSGFSHAPSFTQPVKKTHTHSHYTYDTIKTPWKPNPWKPQDPAEVQRAREEFIETWLQQARLTLDARPPTAPARPSATETEVLADEVAVDYQDDTVLLEEGALEATPAEGDQLVSDPSLQEPEAGAVEQQPEFETLPVEGEPLAVEAAVEPDYYDMLVIEDEVLAGDTAHIAPEEEFVGDAMVPKAEAVPTLVEQDTTVILQTPPEEIPEPVPVVRSRRPTRRRKPSKPIVEFSIGAIDHPVYELRADYDMQPEEEPFVEPDVQTFVEPDVQTFVEPDVEPFTEPDVQPFMEPEVQSFKEPIKEDIWETTAEPITEPVQEPITELVEEPITIPTDEPIAEPVEPTTESIVEPGLDPAEEHTEEPAVDAVTEPVKEGAEEPSEEPTTRRQRPSRPRSKPGAEPAVQPIDKPQATRRTRPKSSSGRSFSAASPTFNHQRSRPVHRPILSPFNGEGLDYTLEYFPSHGLSHYYVSTPIGGGGRRYY